jgi:hypothetical protein
MCEIPMNPVVKKRGCKLVTVYANMNTHYSAGVNALSVKWEGYFYGEMLYPVIERIEGRGYFSQAPSYTRLTDHVPTQAG